MQLGLMPHINGQRQLIYGIVAGLIVGFFSGVAADHAMIAGRIERNEAAAMEATRVIDQVRLQMRRSRTETRQELQHMSLKLDDVLTRLARIEGKINGEDRRDRGVE